MTPVLSITASASTVIQSNGYGLCTLVYLVTDARPFLAKKHANLTVDWGDGSPSASSQFDTLVQGQITLTHVYLSGSYILTLSARNYQLPRPDSATVSFPVEVQPLNYQPIQVVRLPATIFGPILPRDEGFPGPDQWNWHFSDDNLVLESSIRHLLLTRVGERLMELDYGTNIGNLLFNQIQASLTADVQQELIRACSVNEQRVTIGGLNVTLSPDKRQAVIDLTLISKLDNTAFNVATTLVRQ